MGLGRHWAGKLYGTNTGNLFVKMSGADEELKGTLHHNEPGVGIVVYDISGAFDGDALAITGTPQLEIEGLTIPKFSATGKLQPNGNLEGEWNSTIGSAGTFILFPHDQAEANSTETTSPDQMYTARHNFGPIAINRDQFSFIADEIQRGFLNAKVVVTFIVGTEKSLFLDDFKRLNLNESQADLIKLFVREPDGTGIDKFITLEFGQSANWAMCQSYSESWALGELEKLKRLVRRHERNYAAKKYGIGINQFMFVCAIVFLPSLTSLFDRAVLAAGVLGLAFGVNRIHSMYR